MILFVSYNIQVVFSLYPSTILFKYDKKAAREATEKVVEQ